MDDNDKRPDVCPVCFTVRAHNGACACIDLD